MGRHSAREGAPVDPVVADALARRASGAPTARHGDPVVEGTESGLGWPGTSTTHEGLGWPGRTSDEAGPATPATEPTRRRRGWRRLFRAA